MVYSVEEFEETLRRRNESGEELVLTHDELMEVIHEVGITKVISLVNSIIDNQELKLSTYFDMEMLIVDVPYTGGIRHTGIISSMLAEMKLFMWKLFDIEHAKYVHARIFVDGPTIKKIADDYGVRFMTDLVSKIITDSECRVKTYSIILQSLSQKMTVESMRSSFPNEEEFHRACNLMV